MSVLILHPRHIATLAHAFHHREVPKLGEKTPQAWVEKLAQANFRSAQNYYSLGHALKMSGCSCEREYVNQCIRALHESDSRLYSIIELLKLIDTYDYNAFDYPDYSSDKAIANGYDFCHMTQWHLDALRYRLIQQLDGYDAAPAFITDEEVPA